MQFPQTLIKIKDERRLTNAKIGEMAGVSESAVRSWLDGSKTPNISSIVLLCDKLHISTDYLLIGEEKPLPSTISGDVNGSAFVQGTNKGSVTVHNGNGRAHLISEEAADLLKLYEGLPLKKRVKLLQTAIDLSESEE